MGREVVHTLFIFFVDITHTSLIPVSGRAIATFLDREGLLIILMVLFHVSYQETPCIIARNLTSEVR